MARYALVIGTSRYKDAAFQQLVTPQHDVEQLASVLRDPERCAFDDVAVLTNETEPHIRRAIARLATGKERDDMLLLYFSGHGVLDQRGQLYLAAADTEKELLTATGVPAAFVKSQFDLSRSRRQVLILDCCHSGAFTRGTKGVTGQSVGTGAAFDTQGAGRFVLTASDATQYAWEGDQTTGTAQSSVFTRHLVEGLASGLADRDGDGHITLDELYDYLSEAMARESGKQTPLKFADGQQGELHIARNPTPVVKPKDLPPELEEGLESRMPFTREGVVNELGRLLEGSDKGLAQTALEKLREIRDTDDSNNVQAAATRVLEAHGDSADGVPPLPPLPPRPPAPEPRRAAPVAAAPPPTPAPQSPVAAPEPGVVPAASRQESVAKRLLTGRLLAHWPWYKRAALGGAIGLVVLVVLGILGIRDALDTIGTTADPFGFVSSGLVPTFDAVGVPTDGTLSTVFTTAGEGWATFTADQDDVFDLSVSGQFGDPIIQVYDAFSTLIQRVDTSSTVEETASVSLGPGTYYVRLTDFQNSQPGWYDVSVISSNQAGGGGFVPPAGTTAAAPAAPVDVKGVPVSEPEPTPQPSATVLASAGRPGFIPAGVPVLEVTGLTANGTVVPGDGAWMHVSLPAGFYEFQVAADVDTELHLSSAFLQDALINDDTYGFNPAISTPLDAGDYYLWLHLYDEGATSSAAFTLFINDLN